MKHFMTFAFLSGLVLCCHGEEAAIPDDVFRKMSKDKTRWIANARGAKALERFRVVDDLGAPVPRARIEGVWGTPSSNAATFEGETDTNGVFSVTGVSRDMVRFTVNKKGFYSSHGEVRYIDTWTVPAVKNGIWQPGDATRRVVLKRIVNPVEMESSPCLDYYRYPPQGEWTGFDLQKRDWVSPAGSGERPDMLVRFIRQERPNGYYKTMEVSFTNNPYAGVYQMTVDEQSDLKSVYCADTNATYSASLMFDVERNETGLRRNDFKEGQYFVFRTRTSVDDDGKLKSAHYGKIYGDWRFCERGGMAIQRIDFNPRPNDTNLEDAETARLSELNRRNDCR